ncbi:MAG: cbb3-type cytochrome oxidase assembly protein CcoS [Nitrospirota bacterium]|nr:cbb3-type cytochrome oxidase assembly protein CcoS [Nitrospirota bacterium]
MSSLVSLILLSLCLGFAAWFLFLWAAKSGQFDDAERPKYRMLDDDDEESDKKDDQKRKT